MKPNLTKKNLGEYLLGAIATHEGVGLDNFDIEKIEKARRLRDAIMRFMTEQNLLNPEIKD